MNDTERAALVDTVERTINSLLSLVAIHGMKALQAPENRDLIRKESADIVTRLLTSRPEPAADAVDVDRLGSILRMEYARGYQDAKKEMQVRTFSSTTVNDAALQAALDAAKGTEDCGCTSIDYGWYVNDGGIVNDIQCSDEGCPRANKGTEGSE